MEVGGADALAHNVPLGPAGDERQFVLVHDVLELLPDLPHLPHGLDVDEVLATPRRGVAGDRGERRGEEGGEEGGGGRGGVKRNNGGGSVCLQCLQILLLHIIL